MRVAHSIYNGNLPEGINLPQGEPERSQWAAAAIKIMGWNKKQPTPHDIKRWNRFYSHTQGETLPEDWQGGYRASVELVAQKISATGHLYAAEQNLLQNHIIARLKQGQGDMDKKEAFKSPEVRMYLDVAAVTFQHYIKHSIGKIRKEIYYALSEDEIKDIFQDKLHNVLLHETLDFSKMEAVRNMLYSSVKRGITDIFRKKAVRGGTHFAITEQHNPDEDVKNIIRSLQDNTASMPDEGLDPKIKMQQVVSVLEKNAHMFNENERTAIEMFFFGGSNYEKIADRLKLPMNNIKSILYRVRGKMSVVPELRNMFEDVVGRPPNSYNEKRHEVSRALITVNRLEDFLNGKELPEYTSGKGHPQKVLSQNTQEPQDDAHLPNWERYTLEGSVPSAKMSQNGTARAVSINPLNPIRKKMGDLFITTEKRNPDLSMIVEKSGLPKKLCIFLFRSDARMSPMNNIGMDDVHAHLSDVLHDIGKGSKKNIAALKTLLTEFEDVYNPAKGRER